MYSCFSTFDVNGNLATGRYTLLLVKLKHIRFVSTSEEAALIPKSINKHG